MRRVVALSSLFAVVACRGADPVPAEAQWGRDGRLGIVAGGKSVTTAAAHLCELGWDGKAAIVDSATKSTGAARALKIVTSKGAVGVLGNAEATADGLN